MTPLKILVTGVNGFIGSKTIQSFAEATPESSIIGIGRRKILSETPYYPNYENINCELIEGSVHKNLPAEIDAVIHLAGDRRTFVEPNDYTSQTYSNIIMTSNVADYAYSAKAKLFVYASSVYVYSGNSALPFFEDSVDIPRDNLGATKLASEALLKARAVAGQFKAVSLRIGTVYGPKSKPEQFIPQAIAKLLSPDPVAKFGPANIKRDFVYIDDVAEAFVKSVKVLHDKEFTYHAINVGTNKSTSVRDVVLMLAREIKSPKKIEFNTFKNVVSKADTDHQLDISRIKSILGWHPEFNLEEGLRRTIKYFC